MMKATRGRVAGTALGLLILVGCDPNPTGPTFPAVPADAKDDVSAGAAVGEKGSPKRRGRRKATPVQTINDPAA